MAIAMTIFSVVIGNHLFYLLNTLIGSFLDDIVTVTMYIQVGAADTNNMNMNC